VKCETRWKLFWKVHIMRRILHSWKYKILMLLFMLLNIHFHFHAFVEHIQRLIYLYAEFFTQMESHFLCLLIFFMAILLRKVKYPSNSAWKILAFGNCDTQTQSRSNEKFKTFISLRWKWTFRNYGFLNRFTWNFCAANDSKGQKLWKCWKKFEKKNCKWA
jgi:hypothetical protein